MNLATFRKQYPQYNDLSDEQLVKGFHKRFYSDTDYYDFAQKIGFEPPEMIYQPTPPIDVKIPRPKDVDLGIDLAPADFPGGLPEDVYKVPEEKTKPVVQEEPLYDELGLPVGEPEVLGRALEVPFIPGREISRAPGAFTEAEPFEIERKEASISDMGGQLGRNLLQQGAATEAMPYDIAQTEQIGDMGEAIGRLVAEMGVELSTANIMINALAGTIGTTANLIRESAAWRKMTIPERRLVVQSLDDAIRNNPKMSEGEILRRYDVYREEALKRRMKPEVEPTSEVPEGFVRTPDGRLHKTPTILEPAPELPAPKKRVYEPVHEPTGPTIELGGAEPPKPEKAPKIAPGEAEEGKKDIEQTRYIVENNLKPNKEEKVLLEKAKTEGIDSLNKDEQKSIFSLFGDYMPEDNELHKRYISYFKEAYPVKKQPLPPPKKAKVALEGEGKVKRKPKVSTRGTNVRTLRGYVNSVIGGINPLNFKGEVSNLPLGAKYLFKKSGAPIDDAVRQLREDGWLDKDATVSSFLEDLRTNPVLLSRDRLARDIAEKKEYEKTEAEKALEKEMAWEPEEPPKGEYRTIRAEDLPEGKKVTLIEGKSRRGWDVYEIREKDPFSITLVDGETIELKPFDKVQILKEEKAAPEKPKKPDKRVKQFRQLADNLQKTIDEKRSPGVSRQNLTARRARIAAGMAKDADRIERTQTVLRGMADAIEAGTLPDSLSEITNKAQIEKILATTKFRPIDFHKSYLNDLKESIKGVKGLTEERKIINDLFPTTEYRVQLTRPEQVKAVEKAISKGKSFSGKTYIKSDIAEGKRLISAGINSQADLEAAKKDLEQYIRPPSEKVLKERRLKELERELIGAKIPGFFPTPKKSIERMLKIADIKPGMNVLEPSAGKGDIADAIYKETGKRPDVAEINSTLRKILKEKGYGDVTREEGGGDLYGDFLEMKLSKPGRQGLDVPYDRIIMNPPFEKGQDIDHVKHAYELLRGGGRLVSIMSEGPFFRTDKKSIDFRDWLDEVNADVGKTAQKFKGAESFRQTGVATRIVTIDKEKHPIRKQQDEKIKGLALAKLAEKRVSDLSDKEIERAFKDVVAYDRMVNITKQLRDSGEINIDDVYKNKPEQKPNIEVISPDGTYVDWAQTQTKEKHGLTQKLYGVFKKGGTFKKWTSRSEIDRIKAAEGKPILTLKQDTYGKQRPAGEKGEQRGLDLVVEDETQPGLFPKEKPAAPGGFADTGGYAEIPAMIEMPELVKLFKEVTRGEYPRIVKHLRGLAIGKFYPGTGKIKLQADIFQDYNQALKTFAHEIGHWIDWLPDKDLSRGNILGRVASLKHYMKHWLDDILGGPGQLTAADKKRLRAEAKRLEAGEKWIDETIKKELPIEPQDILDIWNAMIDPSAMNPDLYEYVQRLSTADKKSIVKEAMKGQVREDLKKFAQIIKIKTGKKIKVKIKASDQVVLDRYKKLIEEELAKRNIYNRDEIMDELKKFTHLWKPFDYTDSPEYTKYRYKGVELYADAVSGILTNPNFFRSVAPKFWDAWFTWLHRKPEVLKTYNDIQKQIRDGSVEITKRRMDDIYDMFYRGDMRRIEARRQTEGKIINVYDAISTYLWDKNHATLKVIRRLEKDSGLIGDHAKNTRWMLEELNYLANDANIYITDVYNKVLDPLYADGFDPKELGLVLFQRRVLGDRSKVGNPLGHSPKTTIVDMDNIERHIWGPKKTKQIHHYADVLRELRENQLFPLLKESGITTPEFMKIIEDTKQYVTFSNVAWFKDKYGLGPGARFYRQVGTLGEIENPIVSTILKDISLMRAARINMVKRELLVDLAYAGALRPAKLRWSKDVGTKGGRVPMEPGDPHKSLFSVLVDGKADHYYVSKKIADTFNFAPVEAQQLAIIWRYLSQPVRELLVSKNPIWMARNVVRDFRTQIKHVPEVKLRFIPRLAKYYLRAWDETYKDIFKGERSDDIRMMLDIKAIPVNRIWTGKDETFDMELERMAAELNISPVEARKAIGARAKLKRFWNGLDKLGRMSDIWGKVAGFKYLRDYSKRPTRGIAHVVRTRVGTPDYRRIGSGQQITNNTALFSTVGKEGIRATVEAFEEDPGAYIWKTLATNVLPKLIVAAITAGVPIYFLKRMSDANDEDANIQRLKHLQRILEGVSEYDKANYTIVPLGLTKKGKSVFIRIPEDYEGQFWGALAHKIISGKITGQDGILNLIHQQSPYHWHPLIAAASRLIAYYVMGQNPVDPYRGRHVMPEMVYEAGGIEAHKAMAKDVWKELGGSLIYRPAWDGLEVSRENWEKRLQKFPLNVVGTFVRFSDQGITEKIEKKLGEIRQRKARESLRTNKAFIRLANGETITPDDAILILSKPTNDRKKTLMKLIGRKYGTAYIKHLTRPNLSREEKIAIVNLMLKDLPK